jgi:hypothetical protein
VFTAYFAVHWIAAKTEGFLFASSARYEGIADTFVQLFPSCSAGLIELIQGAVERKRYGKEQSSNRHGNAARN